jgi:hypothetical protein
MGEKSTKNGKHNITRTAWKISWKNKRRKTKNAVEYWTETGLGAWTMKITEKFVVEISIAVCFMEYDLDSNFDTM